MKMDHIHNNGLNESTKVQSLGGIVNKQTQIFVLAQGSFSTLRASVDTIICLGYRLLVSHQTPTKGVARLTDYSTISTD